MRNLALLFVFGIAIFSPLVAGAAPKVSRVSGVAPLVVHCDADAAESDGTAIEQFHDYEYKWIFGDENQGVWADGDAKNVAFGPIAAHVYDLPGNYTISLEITDQNGNSVPALGSGETFEVVVSDPNDVFAGILTTCVNMVGDGDFSECPNGAGHINSNDISTLSNYAQEGERLLFKRGGAWSGSSSLAMQSGQLPRIIGAYGTGMGLDEYNHYANDPSFTMSESFASGSVNVWNVTFQNLRIVGAFGDTVTINGRYQLFYRCSAGGNQANVDTAMGWSHWNNYATDLIDHMAIVECKVQNSRVNEMYIGSERLMILGTLASDSSESHVVRVWQAYKSVLSHNNFSGASTDTNAGRHALKFHSPSEEGSREVSHCVPAGGNGCLLNPSKFIVISDNVFGSSGPWPVAIGPQDSLHDERVTDLIFERNRVIADYGSPSNGGNNPVQIAIEASPSHSTFRNNVIDLTGAYNGATAISIWRRGTEPSPHGNRIYNNTIYRGDYSNQIHNGIVLTEDVSNVSVRNNFIFCPNVAAGKNAVLDNGMNNILSNNLIVDEAFLVDPDNDSPLYRDYSPSELSVSLIDQGYSDLAVWDDFQGSRRSGVFDIGAFEYVSSSASCGDGSCNGTEDCATCPADCGTCPRTYDFSDFISLQQAWLTPGSEDTDVNSDNIVNARDLGIMMSGWGE